jgi:hypothetical protein
MNSHSLAGVSFRDPAGFVYHHDGELRRQVNQVYRQHYDQLLASGLYDELVAAKLLVKHDEIDVAAPDPARAYKVIRPQPIEFISYPYEWSLSGFRDAALFVLDVQRRAVLRGLTLKDASAYNVQFHAGSPIWIDTLSFEVYREEQPWVAYRQFCEQFLAPLALMSLQDVRLGQLCRANVDGIPLDLAARLLPWRSRLRVGLALHLHLHSVLQQQHAGRDASSQSGRMSTRAMLGLIDSLRTTVKRLPSRLRRRGWSTYYDEHSYSPDEFENKSRVVADFLGRTGARNVWDLGSNTGHFSRLACQSGCFTVAFDSDPACVEQIYLDMKRQGETRLLPLFLDLFNPTPPLGWQNSERASIFDRANPDLVLALALIHHLAFTGNQPLANLAAFFSRLAPWLLIEFVPETDPQAKRLQHQRRGVHHPYNRQQFEDAFGEHFRTLAAEPITAGGRALYLLQRRDQATV